MRVQPLPIAFSAALAGMVVGYLSLIGIGKRIFCGTAPSALPTRPRYRGHRYLRRRAAYFSTATRPSGRASSRL
jgi:Mg2+-importing ATPase